MKKLTLILMSIVFAASVFAADGDLDLSFNGTGYVTLDVVSGGTSSAVQPDGKILVAYSFVSTSNPSIQDVIICRYNANGSFDADFGTNGRTTIDNAGRLDGKGKVLLGANGKIVVVFKTDTADSNERVGLARLNANGSFDSTFGTNGITISNFTAGSTTFNRYTDAVLQPDGKIAVSGIFRNNSGGFGLARWNADGTVDTTFGEYGGYTHPSFFTSPTSFLLGGAFAVALQSDGKYVLAGYQKELFGSSNTGNDFGLVRYNSDGSFDTTFGGRGFITTDFNRTDDVNYKLFITPNGKILTGGYTQTSPNNSFGFARYNADGSLDTSFGTGGKISILLPITPVTLLNFSMALQADNKIVLAGAVTDSTTDYAIMRLTANGAIDTTFGTNGKVQNNLMSITDINLQPDGKIIAVGRIGLSGNGRTALYNNSAAQPPVVNPALRFADFDGDGKTDVSVFRQSNGTWYINPSTAPNNFYGVQFGISTDITTPADFDGDGKSDIAVWRGNAGNGDRSYFYILNSSTGTFRAEQFGKVGDNPTIAGDWDGDGKADPAVFRQASSVGGQSYFFYRPSSQPGSDFQTIYWGSSDDTAIFGDFDGDRKLDATVYRPSENAFYVRRSTDGLMLRQQWGNASTDAIFASDFDGDGKSDFAVQRFSGSDAGTWYILQSGTTPAFRAVRWGLGSDTPVPADYDGDGKTDFAVFRRSDRIWYVLNSGNGTVKFTNFGLSSDFPLPLNLIR